MRILVGVALIAVLSVVAKPVSASSVRGVYMIRASLLGGPTRSSRVIVLP